MVRQKKKEDTRLAFEILQAIECAVDKERNLRDRQRKHEIISERALMDMAKSVED